MSQSLIFIMSPEQLSDFSRNLIEEYVSKAPPAEASQPVEILTPDQLCERLQISVNTQIRYRKKGKIPCMEVGSTVRYNLHDVIKALTIKKR